MNSAKRNLFISIFSLVICIAMLVSTTFAWFTDSVTSGINTIVAGNLDIELEYWNGTDWVPVDSSTLLFDDDARWEPGHTEVAHLHIKNAGTLSLKYKMAVNVANELSGINVFSEEFRLSDYLVFGKVDMADASAVFQNDDTGRQQARAAVGDTAGLSTYTEADNLYAESDANKPVDGKTEKYMALVIYMPETVGNEANYMSGTTPPQIELGVSVVATQLNSENDSFGPEYDAGAVYPVISVDELKAALATPDSYISLGSDITVPSTQLGSNGYGKSGLEQRQGGTIDGNGNTISAEGATGTWDATIYTKGGTIKNAEITGGFRGIFIAYPTEDIIIDNVIINPIAYPINCDAGSDKNLIVTNSTLNGWTSFAGTLASAEFTDCKFGSNGTYAYLRPYCATTLTNCEFSDGFALDATRTSEITLVNCTYNGTPITAANLISLLGADAAGATVN